MLGVFQNSFEELAGIFFNICISTT